MRLHAEQESSFRNIFAGREIFGGSEWSFNISSQFVLRGTTFGDDWKVVNIFRKKVHPQIKPRLRLCLYIAVSIHHTCTKRCLVRYLNNYMLYNMSLILYVYLLFNIASKSEASYTAVHIISAAAMWCDIATESWGKVVLQYTCTEKGMPSGIRKNSSVGGSRHEESLLASWNSLHHPRSLPLALPLHNSHAAWIKMLHGNIYIKTLKLCIFQQFSKCWWQRPGHCQLQLGRYVWSREESCEVLHGDGIISPGYSPAYKAPLRMCHEK